MLDWLKTILGDHYTEDIDKLVSAEIGKGFVARADFNAKNEDLKGLQGQLKTAQDGLKAFEGVDVNALNGKIQELQSSMASQADGYAFDSLLDGAIRDAKGKNVQAIRGMLGDLAPLRASKDRSADVKAAVDALVNENAWAFEAALPEAQPPAPTPVSSGSPLGSAPAGGIDYDKMTDDEIYTKLRESSKA